LNIFIHSRDIRRQSLKLSEIVPNFACFWPLKFFGGELTKLLDLRYKIQETSDHGAKFRRGRLMQLGNTLAK